MKKLWQVFCGFPLVFVLLLGMPSLSAQAQQQENARVGHVVSVPAAKDRARQKAAQSRSISPSATTMYVDTPNWAGYLVGSGTGNGFKGVEGNWNAPCTSGAINSQIGYSSWVGLGGAFGNGVFANPNGVEPLEQAGVLLQSDGTYRLFWEYVSTNQPPFIDYSDVVHCGDHLSAFVIYGSSYCSNGGFYAHVQDNTTGAHLGSTCLTESDGLGIQSAEWIDERPSIGNCYQKLADFRYTQWSNVLAQPNGSGSPYQNPNNFVNRQLFMYSGSTELADPDGLSVASNNTFTDRWYANGTVDCF